MGTWGATVGDREESLLGKRERGDKKERAEKRKWAAEVLATSFGEDQSNREITTCHRSELLCGAWQERFKLSSRSTLQGPRPGRCWKGLQWDRSSFFWPGLARESSFRTSGRKDGESSTQTLRVA